MRTHEQIDQRSLAMAKAVVSRIDADPEKSGLTRARQTCRRWAQRNSTPAVMEWLELLGKPWAEIRLVLLSESEEGCRLRQNSPFCGVLAPGERWRIYREHRSRAASGP